MTMDAISALLGSLPATAYEQAIIRDLRDLRGVPGVLVDPAIHELITPRWMRLAEQWSDRIYPYSGRTRG